MQRKQRPPPHELDLPVLARHRREPGELRVLVLAHQGVLHEVGHRGVVDVGLVDVDAGRGHVEVLEHAEDDLLAHRGARLVDGCVEEVERPPGSVERQPRIGVDGRRRRRLLVRGIDALQ